MNVLSPAAVLCVFFAVVLAAPAEVMETQAEENTVPDGTLDVGNMVGALAPLPKAEAAETGIQEDVSPDRTVLCPPGWFAHGSRCFLLVKTARTWISAENYCVAQQGNLASVQSPDQYHFLQTLAQLSGISVVWIGGFYFQGTWMWTDGAGFYYTNWYSQNTASSYPCVYLQSYSGWLNNNCGYSYPFFCVRNGASC